VTAREKEGKERRRWGLGCGAWERDHASAGQGGE